MDSLWRVSAEFVDALAAVYFAEPDSGDDGRALTPEELERMAQALARLKKWCTDIDLKTSVMLIEAKERKPPKSSGELDMIWISVEAELKERLFLHIPSHRAKYHNKEDALSEGARAAFPKAAQELHHAGNCFAVGMNTASAFHCMRALEYGIGALAADVGVVYEVQNWQNVLDQIAKAISDQGKALPAGMPKSERLQFLSEAVSEFRYFKDGWRNHVSHNKVSYDESQAAKIFEHVSSFIESLVPELKERA
ncbi:hypothetical protein RHIZO_02661 [Rhizobiaceae bacterium]|nr:hypothetical protein RHIZO_02661 [Rhizobiaceae bacterium]